jgi:uncharacterized protein involved in exopolysaccharide biosynthesis
LVLSASIGLAASYLLRPRYEAELVALPRGSHRGALLNSLGGQLGELGALAGISAADGGERAEAIQMLQSQVLARRFIQGNSLTQVLFASAWDSGRERWRVANPPTLNDAALYFDRHVRDVSEDRRTGLVTVRITWTDPVRAAQWANEIVRLANEQLRNRAVVRAQGAIDYLKREAQANASVEVQQALYRLMEDQYKTLLLANVSEDYAFSVIDPAVASDAKHYVFPNRGLFSFAGLFFGGVFVLILAFAQALHSWPRAPYTHDPS